jgi:hypothetical protein
MSRSTEGSWHYPQTIDKAGRMDGDKHASLFANIRKLQAKKVLLQMASMQAIFITTVICDRKNICNNGLWIKCCKKNVFVLGFGTK